MSIKLYKNPNKKYKKQDRNFKNAIKNKYFYFFKKEKNNLITIFNFNFKGVNMNTETLFNINEEKKEKVINTLSKSDIYLYEQCPLKLWKKNKYPEKYKFRITNKNTLIGIRAHELIQRAIEKKYSKDKGSVKFSNRITDPAVKLQAKKIADDFIYFLENEIIEKGEVIGVEEALSMKIEELDIILKGIIDLMILKESKTWGTYIHVIDFKRKFIKNYLDNEALIYAYLVGHIFGLPVMFERISIEDKNTFQYFFHLEELIEAKEDVNEYLKKIVNELKTEEAPIANPSAENCLECPFYKECLKEAEEEFDKIKMKSISDPKFAIKAIQKLKVIEVFRKEIENNLKAYMLANNFDELELEDIGVEAKINTIKYPSLGRKIKKDQIVPKLLKEGLIPEEKYSLLSLKIDDFLPEIKKAFKIENKDIKWVERKNLSIKVTNKKKEKKNA